MDERETMRRLLEVLVVDVFYLKHQLYITKALLMNPEQKAKCEELTQKLSEAHETDFLEAYFERLRDVILPSDQISEDADATSAQSDEELWLSLRNAEKADKLNAFLDEAFRKLWE
jgi:hypothetical protein